MKPLLCLLLLLSVPALRAAVPSVTPTEAAKLVAGGTALLVDVREPSEWVESGVAAPAVLLPKSEFDEGLIGGWKDFLAQAGNRQIIVYCRSGRRSEVVAAALAEQGHQVANAGGFKDWQAAGLPTRKVVPENK